MTYFNRTINSTPALELQHLMHMYKVAGLEAPTKYGEVRALIVNVPEPHQVTKDYAERAYQSDNPEALVAEARAAITDAIAAYELRKQFLAIESTHLSKELRGMKAQFREDAAKAFSKDIKRFTDAVNQLDPHDPLAAELAVAQDTGQALTTVRELLPKLGAYAALWTITNHNAPAALNQILPILDLPPIVKEQVYRTLSEGSTTLNPEDAAGTLTIRQLGKDAHTNVDLALINIARGNYPGVSFSLNAPTPNLTDAYMQVQVDDKRGRFM